MFLYANISRRLYCIFGYTWTMQAKYHCLWTDNIIYHVHRSIMTRTQNPQNSITFLSWGNIKINNLGFKGIVWMIKLFQSFKRSYTLVEVLWHKRIKALFWQQTNQKSVC